ncbi:MAG: inositol monophosphatase [Bacteroides sp.]|nr:inositol monophosphatase [Roseburia sp.]MCM1345581.1 inositol monophosphatase [Bacteroides sp.]MCM1421264.1 inositol monophosphatase [Bacteroides sp.]
MIDLNMLTEQVKQLALEIGAFLRNQRRNFQAEKVVQKRSHDYVSYVDKESERRIVERLHELLPEAGFVAEEGSGIKKAEKYWWVVDPLDGTTNFIHDNAPYCVSIALMDETEVLLGVVYECCRDELFWANKESHAFLNGHEIKVSDVNTLDQSLVLLGLPYDAEAYREFVTDMVRRLYGNTCSLRGLGSAAAELCYVACGRYDAYVEGFIYPWDVAAGSIILRQAGGKITDNDGGAAWTTGKEVVATNGHVHSELLLVVKDCADKFL